jgi:hypothetical protein
MISHYRMSSIWSDSSIPQNVYVGKLIVITNPRKVTAINLNAPTNITYNGYIIITPESYDSQPGQFPNDYIYQSLSYNDLTIDPTTRILSSASRSLGEDLASVVFSPLIALYMMLVPKTPVYIPYFSNDVTLTTLLDTSQMITFDFGHVGPNRVFVLNPPVSGNQYIYENGLDPAEGGEMVVNGMNLTQPLGGYPLIKDEKSNGFFHTHNTVSIAGLITYNLFYIYGDTLQILLLGTFTINYDNNSFNTFGVYGAIHNPKNDSLYIPISGMINFWDVDQSSSLSNGIHLLDIGSKFRQNINMHSTNPVPQSAIHILGTSDVPSESRITGVSYILPRGGTWGIDVDGYGNIYATLGDGFVIKVKSDYTSYSVVCNGLLEPWNICVIDKNSLMPTLLVANTRYGTIILVNPDGSVQTICGTPIMPYQEGYGKTIHDTSVTYPYGVFGCPTSVTITPDYAILVGDETGQAIRKIESQKLAYKIQQLQANQPSQPVVQPTNGDSFTIVILILLFLFLLVH